MESRRADSHRARLCKAGRNAARPPFDRCIPITRLRLTVLTTLALLAFAGNSLLGRLALRDGAADPASFTTIRLIAGALTLWLIVRLRQRARADHGDWRSASALFAYAAPMSFAYLQMSAATGALLLFGAVQTTMIGQAWRSGERPSAMQSFGLALACAGLLSFLLPGFSAPPLPATLLMLASGAAWGVYSLLGRGARTPIEATAGNFLRTLPMTLMLSALCLPYVSIDRMGFEYAVASGALTSGIGYAIWYAALPALKSTQAAALQLAVPLLAALGAVLFLGEAIGVRLLLASLAVLGGIALTLATKISVRPT